MSKKAYTIVTGANSGIGFALCLKLLKADVPIVVAARSLSKAKDAIDRMIQAVGEEKKGQQLAMIRPAAVDMSSLQSVADFASSFTRSDGEHSSIAVDVLVNNAGVMEARHRKTIDGFENTWQVNALSQWLLTTLMMPKLALGNGDGDDGGVRRCIYIGSRLERRGTLSSELIDASIRDVNRGKDMINPDNESFSTFSAYANSKQAATSLFLHMGQTNNQDDKHNKVLFFVATPGMVHTGLPRFMSPLMQYLTYPLRYWLLPSPDTGADTPAWLCVEDPLVLHRMKASYFGKRQPVEASEQAKDPELAAKLSQLMRIQCEGYL